MHWREDQTNKTASAIEQYLAGGQLSIRDVILIRNYFQTFLREENTAVTMNPAAEALLASLVARARVLNSEGEIRAFVADAATIGLYPL